MLKNIHKAASTALRWQREVSWTSKGTSYCGVIQDVNKEERLSGQNKTKKCHLKTSFIRMRPRCKLNHINELVATREGTNLGLGILCMFGQSAVAVAQARTSLKDT